MTQITALRRALRHLRRVREDHRSACLSGGRADAIRYLVTAAETCALPLPGRLDVWVDGEALLDHAEAALTEAAVPHETSASEYSRSVTIRKSPVSLHYSHIRKVPSVTA
jgi:hypothetical protein